MTWITRLIPGFAPDGGPILSILAKKTYRFAHGKAAWPDEEQFPFLEADEHLGKGNPASDAMRLESDLVAYKPMTDFILIGKAHAPHSAKVPHLDVGVQAGAARKIARVFGDRKAYVTATGIAFTAPEPFSEMSLDYSRAYGGADERSDDGVRYVYLKNPTGKGFLVKASPKSVQDLALPNIEDPARPLTPQNLAIGKFENWPTGPEPVAFGAQGKNFHPRFMLAGLTPDQWTEAEASRQLALARNPEVGSKNAGIPPQRPPLLNPMFFNGAAPGLALPPMRGGEMVKFANMDREQAQFSFTLPTDRPVTWVDTGTGPVDMPTALHTVVVYKETNQFTLVWRGAVKYGGLESMKKFTNLEFGAKEG